MFELWSTLSKGGILMIPIGLCSIAALAVVIERLLALRDHVVLPQELILKVRGHLSNGETAAALALCQASPLALARIFEAGIAKAQHPREEIAEAMEAAGRQEIVTLERYIGVLATVASVSPLLGLLGTVKGMIEVFQDISVQGVGNPSALSGGISEALLTTAAGLVVGIPTLVAHHYFHQKAQRLSLRMEKEALGVLDHLVPAGAEPVRAVPPSARPPAPGTGPAADWSTAKEKARGIQTG